MTTDASTPDATPEPESTPAPDAPAIGDDLSLKELEKLHIEAVLKRCGGNRTRAAEILGINRSTLRKKLRQHKLP